MKPQELSAYSEQELREELARRRSEREAKTLWDLEDQLEQEQALDYGESIRAYLEKQGQNENNLPKPCPRCKKLVRVRAQGRTRTVRTINGEVAFQRNYHFCEECREGFYPKDQELGLPLEGKLSAKMEARVLDFGVNTPYEEAAQRWSVHYPIPISEQVVRSVVKRRGNAWGSAPAETRQQGLGSNARPADVLVVQSDGSMLSTRDQGWKEAKVAVLYREEHHTRSEEGGRAYLSQARYTATMEGSESFEQEVNAALAAEQGNQAGQVVWVADGAPWNWNLCQAICPKATQVLDVMHALEHGMACGKEVLGEDPALLSLWEQRLKQLLLEESPEALLRELGACLFGARGNAKKALFALYRYYHTHQKRMRYREYRESGYPIGSGTVESAHRHVLQSRMKRAGQHWNHKRAHQMASLRAAYKTVGPARFYETVRLAA